MKNKSFFLNTALAVILAVVLLIAVVIRTFLPAANFPALNLPNMVLISLLALLAEHALAPNGKRCYVCVFLLSAVTFGLLPWAAGFADFGECWKTALAGGVVLTVTALVFATMEDRIATGKSSKATLFISALGLYFAAQCLSGLIV